MGKSMNGPDWTDVALYMREMQKQLAVDITMLITPDGSIGGGFLCVDVLASSKALTADGPLWSVAVQTRWPCRAHREFAACVLASLASLDSKMTQRDFLEKLDIK